MTQGYREFNLTGSRIYLMIYVLQVKIYADREDAQSVRGE